MVKNMVAFFHDNKKILAMIGVLNSVFSPSHFYTFDQPLRVT